MALTTISTKTRTLQLNQIDLTVVCRTLLRLWPKLQTLRVQARKCMKMQTLSSFNLSQFLAGPCPKVRALCASLPEVRTLCESAPKVRTLSSFRRAHAQKCEPFAGLRPKREPFQGFDEHVAKSANPLRVFGKSVNPFKVLATMCPKVRTLCKCFLKMRTLLIICLDVQSYAKTSNPFFRICTKSAPPHDRPKSVIFMINL